MSIFLILRVLSNISNLVLCWISLRSFKFRSPVYARIFSVLCFFEQGAEVLQWFAVRHPGLQIVTDEAVVFAETITYGFIFYYVIHSKTVRWVTASLLLLYFVRFGFLLAKNGITVRLPVGFDLFSYIILLIPCFAYFREIFTFRRDGDLLRDFTFWLVTGTMFSCASTIVNIVGLGFLNLLKLDNSHNSFYLLFSFAFIIGNILFIKAYLCLSK